MVATITTTTTALIAHILTRHRSVVCYSDYHYCGYDYYGGDDHYDGDALHTFSVHHRGSLRYSEYHYYPDYNGGYCHNDHYYYDYYCRA